MRRSFFSSKHSMSWYLARDLTDPRKQNGPSKAIDKIWQGHLSFSQFGHNKALTRSRHVNPTNAAHHHCSQWLLYPPAVPEQHNAKKNTNTKSSDECPNAVLNPMCSDCSDIGLSSLLEQILVMPYSSWVKKIIALKTLEVKNFGRKIHMLFLKSSPAEKLHNCSAPLAVPGIEHWTQSRDVSQATQEMLNDEQHPGATTSGRNVQTRAQTMVCSLTETLSSK